MVADTFTPNVHLTKIAGDARNWTERMNNNLTLIDSVIAAYFVVQNLQGIWQNSTAYTVGQAVVDETSAVVYQCLIANTSSSVPTTFAEERAAHATYWGVYSSPARARGAWEPNTSYAVNDFVVSGAQYAICIQTHVSGSTFAADLADSKWSVLVDLSSVGTAVLPVPGGIADGSKVAMTNPTGTGYTIVATSTFLTDMLGATTIGSQLLTAGSAASARSIINAQQSGSYQPLSAALTALSTVTTGAEGLVLLALATLADLKSHLGGLGTAAPLNVGTGANNIVQLDGSAKIPALDGSQLTNLPSSGATTGDVKFTFKTIADSGWIMVNDGSIGSASSGATTRANADTASLYALFWANCADADAPVSGGRGANAAADFAANKPISLPKSLGRSVGFGGSGSGLTTRALGSVVGEETHVLSTGELASHTHGSVITAVSAVGAGVDLVDAAGTGQFSKIPASTTGSTGSAGSGTAHNNMQPTTFLNGMIKL